MYAKYRPWYSRLMYQVTSPGDNIRHQIDELVQERRNSIANALELRFPSLTHRDSTKLYLRALYMPLLDSRGKNNSRLSKWILTDFLFWRFYLFWQIFFLILYDLFLSLTHCGLVMPYGDKRSGSTLAQVMACCQIAASHYRNQCLLIICEVQ